MEKKYTFKVDEIDTQLPLLLKNGVTEITINDQTVSCSKKQLLKIINLFAVKAPQIFVSILADASVLDTEIAVAATKIYCSFDIPLKCTSKGNRLLFDKKFYANKAKLLNDFGLVFGFQLTYAVDEGDSLKSFMERLDFAVQQYPNHIEFLQEEAESKVTGTFSAKDIRYARNLAFACSTFYSEGRAVTWMLSVLNPLRIYPSKFFADFAEWQLCNNCDYKSGFIPESQNHEDLEKMQLLFLDEKYEEKNRHDLLPLVHDIVRINGAMTRVVADNKEQTLETSYHPDDLFGPESLDLISFFENVCMEDCKVHLFATEEGPDWEIIS